MGSTPITYNHHLSLSAAAAALSFRTPSSQTTPTNHSLFFRVSRQYCSLSIPFWPYPPSPPFPFTKKRSCITRAKSKNKNQNPLSEPLLSPSIVEEVSTEKDDDDDDEQLLLDEFEDEGLVEGDDYFQDEYFDEDAEPHVGDGEGGGGLSLAGTWWDKKALAIAEEVSLSFDGDLKIYAFKTLINSSIRVRIEKLLNRSGSPTMEDVEAFSSAYRVRLDEAEVAKSIPENISLERCFLQVSSPGVERVVRIPQDLERFKDRPMYVKYITEVTGTDSSSEHNGVFRLVAFDLETSSCTWGLADVRLNREKAGRGRPLSKKQREWRLTTAFVSLRLVRIHSEI